MLPPVSKSHIGLQGRLNRFLSLLKQSYAQVREALPVFTHRTLCRHALDLWRSTALEGRIEGVLGSADTPTINAWP